MGGTYMKCKNCGNELNENDIFCSVCGTRTEGADNTAVLKTQEDSNITQFTPSGFNANPIPPEPQKKKRSIGKIVAAACGVVVIALGATGITLAATGKFSNYVNRTFSSPEEYLKDVTEKNVDNNLTAFNESYTQCFNNLDTDNLNGNSKIEVEVGDALKPLIGVISPEFAKLEKAAVEVNASIDGSVENTEIIASVNGSTIATLNSTMDFENKKGYMQVPELSDGYIDVSPVLEKMTEELDNFTSNYMDAINQMSETMPDADSITNIMDTYSDIVYEHMGEVEKTTETIEVKGIEQKCTALTARLDGNYAYDVVCDVLQTMLVDADVEKVVTSIDEDLYEDLITEIENALEKIQNNEDEIRDMDFDMDYVYYVDSKGEVVGEELNIETVEQKIKISCLMPQKGSDFGYICSCEVDGVEQLVIEGEGSVKKDLLNGTFSLSMDEELLEDADVSSGKDLVVFEISDFDMADMKSGYLNGSFKVYSNALTQLSGCQLIMDMSSDDANATVAITVASDDDEWGRITISSGEGKEIQPLKPSKDDKVYSADNDEEMQEYVENIDVDGFADTLSKATGIEITAKDISDFMQEIFAEGGYSDGLEDDNYWSDDYSDYNYDDFDWGDDDLDGDVDFGDEELNPQFL